MGFSHRDPCCCGLLGADVAGFVGVLRQRETTNEKDERKLKWSSLVSGL